MVGRSGLGRRRVWCRSLLCGASEPSSEFSIHLHKIRQNIEAWGFKDSLKTVVAEKDSVTARTVAKADKGPERGIL